MFLTQCSVGEKNAKDILFFSVTRALAWRSPRASLLMMGGETGRGGLWKALRCCTYLLPRLEHCSLLGGESDCATGIGIPRPPHGAVYLHLRGMGAGGRLAREEVEVPPPPLKSPPP